MATAVKRRSKYDLLSRSQIVIRVYQLDNVLLSAKSGSERYRMAQRERLELLEALRVKDDALIRRFFGDK